MNQITFVTGIWDLDRGDAQPGWQRPFEHYIDNFIKLLNNMQDHNLVIFIDPKHEHIVWEHRRSHNTKVVHHTKNDFSNSFFPFFDQVQKIRTNPDWYNQVGWLKDSTQGSLEFYNPMVMSKMFMLHNAKIFNPFDSQYFYWIDGGITNTMDLGYFKNSIVLKNLLNISKKFLFICFPYETSTEIHGFKIDGMKKYAKSSEVNRVARGGFFGGHKDCISSANDLYYYLLDSTLSEGYMGTEESIFTLMTYLDEDSYKYEMIQDNGLIYYFFDQLQIPKYKSKNHKEITLYINTYQSHDQLRMLMDSFSEFDPNFLSSTNKILINNTVQENLFSAYDELTEKYNLQEIRNGNMGICGARQWTAEHFAKSNSDYMLFFEDDMLLDFNGYCMMGLNKNIPDLLNRLISIMNKEKFDFLKLSFSEFYGHNGEQWSWHNLPQERRVEYFGNVSSRPQTKFNHIKSLNHTPYVDGEIYYSNWPHIIDKKGNQKIFLDTKWQYPYEQTWMSHIYTLTRNKVVKPAILLASPITHYRKYHYETERKEN
jgi:hypothetical protein